ncbi:MAG: hypothetical protein U5N86_14085 [Planctomycetota bacterium]|nr:hypothetical protein [Planctomycetota bacterium]
MEFLIGLLKVEDADVLDAVWLSLQSLTGKKFLPEASYWNSWWSRVKDGYEFPAADALPEHESVTVGEEELNEAVLLGCDWLLEHQSQDGHFDALDYSAHEGYVADRGRNDTNVCMTALSVMSLLSAGDRGSSAQRAAREGAMARAMNWLVTVPNEGGNYRSDNPVTYVHEQGAAAWVLAEYVAAGHEEYIPYLQQAIEKSMEYRDGDRVWGYPGMVGNTSNSCVTVWYACAFAAARNAGIDLPREGWAAISAWFDWHATIEHSGYVVQREHQGAFRGDDGRWPPMQTLQPIRYVRTGSQALDLVADEAGRQPHLLLRHVLLRSWSRTHGIRTRTALREEDSEIPD